MTAVRQGISFRDDQLRVIGLHVKRIVAGAHVGQLRTAQRAVLEFRGFLGVAQALEKMFLVQHAARGPEPRLQLTGVRTLRETGFQHRHGFFVTPLVDESIGDGKLARKLVWIELERGPGVRHGFRLRVDLATR